MPSLQQLRYLIALADTLHFRRAAEACHVTQPTLSAQLKDLEIKLGAQLVACRRPEGPVIIANRGVPPANHMVTRHFKAIVRDLELREELRISDARSGGGTEAAGLVDGYTMRDAMQHTQSSTTDRYIRGRSARANEVLAARAQMRIVSID